MGKTAEQLLGVLGGAVGDWLERGDNGLATPMALFWGSQPLTLEPEALRSAVAQARPHVAVLIHGLMATEHGFALGELAAADYGELLHQHKGMTPLRLRYNSGLPAERLGAELAALLAQLDASWPVPLAGISLICHSMGGLVARAAWGAAQTSAHLWPAKVRHIAYLGTPHGGAPLEVAGRRLTAALQAIPDPVAQLIGQVGDLRSEGIRQLGDAAALPWPAGPEQLLVAGSLAGGTPLAPLLGDGMVSVRSALAAAPEHRRPAEARTEVLGGTLHAQLAFSPRVAELLLAWLPDRRQSEHAELHDENPFAAEPDAPPSRRTRGAIQLGLQAVRAGHRAVAQVRLGRADQILAAVQLLAPSLGGVAQTAHTLHAGVVTVQHGAIDAGMAVAGAVAEVVQGTDRGAADKPPKH